MNVRVFSFCLGVVLLAGVPAAGAGASWRAGEGGPGEPVRLSMKEVSAPSNSAVRVPVYLTVPSGVPLRSLSFSITYPKKMLSFSSAERGVLLQSKDFAMEAKTEAHRSGAGMEVAEISVSLGESPAEKSSLPNGLIVYLNFAVPEKVAPGAVTLENRILLAKTAEGRLLPQQRLAAENQMVNILSPEMTPILACFFYMH